MLARAGIRLVDEHPVRDGRGVLLAELDLADPRAPVGVECQRWQWHATPTAQHRDARRRGTLRQLGWDIVDVWWSDLRHPDRVVSELTYLLGRGRRTVGLIRPRSGPGVSDSTGASISSAAVHGSSVAGQDAVGELVPAVAGAQLAGPLLEAPGDDLAQLLAEAEATALLEDTRPRRCAPGGP